MRTTRLDIIGALSKYDSMCWQSVEPFLAQYSRVLSFILPDCHNLLVKSFRVCASASAIASPFTSSLFAELLHSLFSLVSTGSSCLAWSVGAHGFAIVSNADNCFKDARAPMHELNFQIFAEAFLVRIH